MTNINLTLNRDAEGKISGFVLEGVGDIEAMAFCVSFITAYKLNKSVIAVKLGSQPTLNFFHQGVTSHEAESLESELGTHDGGVYRAPITQEEAESLSDLLHGRGLYEGRKIMVRPYAGMGRGLLLYTDKS